MPSDDGFYAERRWALCRAKMGFMPSVPNYGQAMGTTCITWSCLMESIMFILESVMFMLELFIIESLIDE